MILTVVIYIYIYHTHQCDRVETKLKLNNDTNSGHLYIYHTHQCDRVETKLKLKLTLEGNVISGPS
jgi:hypothetical protein